MIDLDRFHRGERKYLEGIVRDFGPLVLMVTRSHSADLDHAEDLFQDVWKRVFRKRTSFSGKGRFDAWVRRVATNVCIADYRARKARSETLRRLAVLEPPEEYLGSETPLASLEREELYVRLNGALSMVTEREREAIELRFFECLSPSETAEAMGVTKATVRSLIRKGVHRIRKIAEGL